MAQRDQVQQALVAPLADWKLPFFRSCPSIKKVACPILPIGFAGDSEVGQAAEGKTASLSTALAAAVSG